MKGIMKFLAVIALISTAGKAVSGEKIQYPSLSETMECLHGIASEVMELAEKFGYTFNYSTESGDVQ